MAEKTASGSQLPVLECPSSSGSELPSPLEFILSIGRRKVVVRSILCACLLILFLKYSGLPSIVTGYPSGRNHIDHVYNTTLGFQRVFVINLPQRTDKKDLTTMASSFAGFEVDYIPGVKAEDVSEKAAPSNWDHDAQNPGVLGCWRAHMNILQKIVAERIQTAMIIEDDADWSPFIKDQLFELATGARALQKSSDSVPSPYGHDWHLLWLGHNRIGPTDQDQNIWVIDHDFTVPPLQHRNSRWRQSHVPEDALRNDTRLLFKAYAGMCLYGYAVTYDGARKMLSSISVQPRNQPVDQSVSDMCRGKMAQGFECYGIWPPLISTHRSAGYKSQDSDININAKVGWHQEYTFDIPFSTTINIPRLADGATSVLSQWPDTDVQEAPINPEIRRRSQGYLKNINFGALPIRDASITI
ncbi:uncharacterized protein Z520_06543 [Fonsecaea multimorphosa CBS 102226]|uniref:Glycosyl transferase family 25 domain-containing protein n=1 Tax=Fonsecaea multimorphosa CBS 102226 TaxID=1442371 RepID=A0A0D2H7D5_9EURO|nr:uncharacterized protein Z520_06543 [Fonsecaea multimorphosa CBS 102226]KIX97765.1 hypothetical protein Z520_06543 [Fonsecaea multimorphosa CBS 102226]OAL23785.1 hypothetical protein AYO22_06104 [Fonsecaea multimorphosa]